VTRIDVPGIEPLDEHNRRLVANVAPPDWTNPEPRRRYHLVVVGAGTGGLVSAAIAAGLGARVALVERHLMGGDCLNVGCVPSKSVIAAARAWRSAAEAARAFAGPRVVGSGDFASVMERMRRIRSGLSRVDSAARFRELGVDVFLGEGRFTGRDEVSVAGRKMRFHRAVVATGGRPVVPAIAGLESAGFLTNETVFNLTEPPGHLVVLGAGPIGCELAQAFARLGVKVSVVEQGARILPSEDAEAARIVAAALERDGVRLLLGARVSRVETRGGLRVLGIERDGSGEEVSGDRILVATGRRPVVEGLGLETAGVRFDQGGVLVDDRLRTSNRRIYAVGDVCSRQKFTHVADAHARLVVANALFAGFGGGRVGRLVIPRVTYTSPEVAHVGLDPQEIANQERVRTITVRLGEVDRAVLDGQEDGFLRVHLAGGSDRIVAGTLVAEHAGEMIGELTVAMTSGLGLARVGAAIHPYPTQSEAFRKAADAWRRGRLTPRAKRVLGWWLGLLGR
jgi:pyruvate/2-oxoglutarate dehydrogenase complex dihydrolipoamide dehydrogenase (E3) component